MALNKERRALPSTAETLSSATPPFLAHKRLLKEDNGRSKVNFTQLLSPNGLTQKGKLFTKHRVKAMHPTS